MIRDGELVPRGCSGGHRGVEVRSANLDELPRRLDVVGSDEQARSQRFRTTKLRDRYIAGRSWLRFALGTEVGLDPAAPRFRYLELGKPVLEYPPNVLDFSLAHSADRALLAIGPPGSLGVDVERIRADVYDVSSAGMVLSPAELRWVESNVDRERAFLRCWVRKEAYAKVGGMGMDRHLAALTVTGPHARPDLDGVVVHDIGLDSGVVAAIAILATQTFVYRGGWSGEAAA
jgi:4'-phosphopantetheinyl transferase